MPRLRQDGHFPRPRQEVSRLWNENAVALTPVLFDGKQIPSTSTVSYERQRDYNIRQSIRSAAYTAGRADGGQKQGERGEGHYLSGLPVARGQHSKCGSGARERPRARITACTSTSLVFSSGCASASVS